MDIIEMEHNNGVEISQRVLWKMLNEAKDEEKQNLIDAFEHNPKVTTNEKGALISIPGIDYYNEKYGTTNK